MKGRFTYEHAAVLRAAQLKAAEHQARQGSKYAYVHMIRNGSNRVAHYRGELKGKGNVTTRLGEKDTGIMAALYGWESRIDISLKWDGKTKRDYVRIMANGMEVLWMPFEVFAKGPQAIVENLAHKALEAVSHG